MQRLVSALSLAVAAALPALAFAEPDCVDVEVRNVQPGRGSLMVAAYIDEAGFAARSAVVSVQVRAGDAPTQRVTVCGVGSASLALMAFQDLNGNGRLDTNPFGIPSEPWGASGTPAAMQAPTWQRTNVAVEAGTPVVVKLSS